MYASKMARQPGAWVAAARVSARGLLATAQHTLTLCGISAIALIVLLMARPDLARQMNKSLFVEPAAAVAVAAVTAPQASGPIAAPSIAATATAAATQPLSTEEKALLGSKKQQQFVTSWLSKRYRVAGDAANMLVTTTYLTARDIKLDPLLILAVMAIESGLNPFAESPVGAQGLMQVMSKIHHARFQEMGGIQAAFNPVANIRVGSLILKDYVTRGGSVEAGLKSYVGAGAFASDDGYGSRVLAEYSRLKQVSAGKKVPTNIQIMAAATPAPAPAAAPAVDSTSATTDKLGKHEEIAGI